MSEAISHSHLSIPVAGGGPGVVLLHAWWGLTPFFRSVCDRLAREGFVALAPDLFGGEVASTIQEAKELKASVDRKPVNAAMKEAVDRLLGLEPVRGASVGILGFSLGANYALWLGRAKAPQVGAIVLYYGAGGGRFDRSPGAVLGHFAEEDAWGAGKERVASLEERLRSGGVDVVFHTYPGTTHWFFEEDRPEAFDRAAASLSWGRTIEFLRARLPRD